MSYGAVGIYLQRQATWGAHTTPDTPRSIYPVRLGGGIRFGAITFTIRKNAMKAAGTSNPLRRPSNPRIRAPEPPRQGTVRLFHRRFPWDYGHDGMLFHLETSGRLKNFTLNSGNNWVDVGAYLNLIPSTAT